MLLVLMIFNYAFDFQQLFDKATTSLVQFESVRKVASDSLIDLGQDTVFTDTVVAFLVSKFDTKNALERHILKDILKGIGAAAIPGIVDKIGYRGSDAEHRHLKQALWVLGEIKSDEAVEPLAPFIEDEEWQIRSAAYTALGMVESRTAVPYLVRGLSDPVAVVRKSAFYGLSSIATSDEVSCLITGLGDEFYGVRYAAVRGLEQVGVGAVNKLCGLLGNNRTDDFFIIQALVHIGAQDTLLVLVENQPPEIRCCIYEALPDSMLLQVLDDEPDPMLKAAIELLLKEE